MQMSRNHVLNYCNYEMAATISDISVTNEVCQQLQPNGGTTPNAALLLQVVIIELIVTTTPPRIWTIYWSISCW